MTKATINQAGFFLIGKSSKLSQHEVNQALKEFRLIHQHPMTLFRHLIDRKLKKCDIANSLVSQRLKRVSSIIKKLKIQKNMNLSRMQDIGGLRIVLDTVSEVNLVRSAIKEAEEHRNFKFSFANEKNYIDNPPNSGYRSIHMVYKYNKNVASEKQCRVEIQIRTTLQHSWATAVEVMGTYLNQPLKQSFGDKKYLDIFTKISKLFLGLENHKIDYELVRIVKQDIEEITLLRTLESFNITTNYVNENSRGVYLLLKMDFRNENVSVSHYSGMEQAIEAYSLLELKNLKNKTVEIVLVSIKDIKKLEQSYPNYFMDTKEFIANLKKLFKINDMHSDNVHIKDDKIRTESMLAFNEILAKIKK